MEPFLGQIQAFGFNFAPRGWAFCQGQALSIQQNTALFSLLGTTYGGDGVTTFKLPDLRGRVMVGAGQGQGLSAVQIGELGGNESVTLTIPQMPAHSHAATATSTLYAEGQFGTKANPQGNLMGGAANMYIAPDPTSNIAMSAEAIVTTVTNANAGSSSPVSLRNPYMGTNVCIATEGIFPSRS